MLLSERKVIFRKFAWFMKVKKVSGKVAFFKGKIKFYVLSSGRIGESMPFSEA
jgi:hypothetical protein